MGDEVKRLALLLLFAPGLALAGCAGSGRTHSATINGPRPMPILRTSPNRDTRSLLVPLTPKTTRRLERLHSARFLSPTRLAIPGILGSSNCPSVPVKLVVQRPDAIRVDLAIGSWRRTSSGLRVRFPHPPRICLANLVRLSVVVVAINPKQIDVHHRLTIRLYYPKGVILRYKRPVVVTAPPL
jgi:hypothetical protein